MAVTAVIPLKALADAKGRLAPGLDPASRRELVEWMFTRVVSACLRAASVGDVLVVAGDEEAAALAGRWPVRVLVEPRPGLAMAIAHADAEVGDAPGTLVVAADLPLVTDGDLDAVCEAGAHRPVVVVAPTADGGTGALLRSPPRVIAAAYGPGSAAAHLRLAAAAGVPVIRLDLPRLAIDVDTPGQLRAAALRNPEMRGWLHALSSAARLRPNGVSTPCS